MIHNIHAILGTNYNINIKLNVHQEQGKSHTRKKKSSDKNMRDCTSVKKYSKTLITQNKIYN